MSVTSLPVPALLTPLSPLAQTGAVALGGVLGCLARWRIGVWLNASSWPIAAGTLAVNVLGGLAIGFCLAMLERLPSEAWRLFLVVGVLGGMTTFSSFTAESLSLLARGEFAVAAMHTGAHVFGALVAAALGWQIGRWAFP